MNIEDYKNTYHNTWLKELKLTIINENKNWILLERTHEDMDYMQMVLMNKNDNKYITWQDINLNVWINYYQNNIKNKWIGHRCFEYDERNIKDLVDLLRVSIL